MNVPKGVLVPAQLFPFQGHTLGLVDRRFPPIPQKVAGGNRVFF